LPAAAGGAPQKRARTSRRLSKISPDCPGDPERGFHDAGFAIESRFPAFGVMF
jgi:hypothetical protein